MENFEARRNLRLLQIFRALRSSMILMPVVVPFFQQNGLSQTDIFVLQSAFAAAILLLEVPSGWFADHFGRKQSMVIGAVLATVGILVYALAYGFWPMLVAEIILGLGVSFISGADAALAYDSLVAVGEEAKYRRFEAFGMVGGSLAEAGASIVGGLIAIASLRCTVWAQVAVYGALIPVALLLHEPKRLRRVGGRNAFRDALRVTKYVLHGHQEVKWLVFYGAVIGTLTQTMVWLVQPYYQLLQVPIGWFGVLAAAQFGAIALSALMADRFERLGRRITLPALVGLGVLSYVLLGLWPGLWILLALGGFYFIRGVSEPILRDYVNRLVASDIRATVLSVKSLAQRLLYIGAGPLIGYVMDVYSLQTALLFSALFYGVLGAVALVAMQRAKLLA